MKKQKTQSPKIDYQAYYQRLLEEHEQYLESLPVGYEWECACKAHKLVKQSDGTWKDSGRHAEQLKTHL